MQQLWDKVRRDLLAAWGYGKEAYGLLRRHPGLLVIPLAVVLFNALENGAGNYVARKHLAMWRVYQPSTHQPWSETLFFGWEHVKIQAWLHGATSLTTSRFDPNLRGLQTLVSTPRLRPTAAVSAFYSLVVFAFWPISLLLGGVICAAYVGQIRRRLAGETPDYPRDIRAFSWPMAGYFLVLALLQVLGLIVSFASSARPEWSVSQTFTLDWALWIAPLLGLFLCLTPMALVNGVPLLVALRNSLKATWSRFPIPLALAVEAALLSLLPMTLYEFLHLLLRDSGLDQVKAALAMIPVDVVCYGIMAVIAVWTTLALFVWYREATAIAPAADDAAPAEAE